MFFWWNICFVSSRLFVPFTNSLNTLSTASSLSLSADNITSCGTSSHSLRPNKRLPHICIDDFLHLFRKDKQRLLLFNDNSTSRALDPIPPSLSRKHSFYSPLLFAVCSLSVLKEILLIFEYAQIFHFKITNQPYRTSYLLPLISLLFFSVRLLIRIILTCVHHFPIFIFINPRRVLLSFLLNNFC